MDRLAERLQEEEEDEDEEQDRVDEVILGFFSSIPIFFCFQSANVKKQDEKKFFFYFVPVSVDSPPLSTDGDVAVVTVVVGDGVVGVVIGLACGALVDGLVDGLVGIGGGG